MRKISPLGFAVAKILVVLLTAEAALFVAGKLAARGQSIVSPPLEVGDWIASADSPPISDIQRDSPNQISVVYTNGDQPPIHLDIAAVQTVNTLRQPQKYLTDSDGRVSPGSMMLKHRTRNAYTISAVVGIDHFFVNVHWYQKPGRNPVPAMSDGIGDELKAILFHKGRYYVCDAWLEWRPTMDGTATRLMLQKFVDSVSDNIKRSN